MVHSSSTGSPKFLLHECTALDAYNMSVIHLTSSIASVRPPRLAKVRWVLEEVSLYVCMTAHLSSSEQSSWDMPDIVDLLDEVDDEVPAEVGLRKTKECLEY
jgi:hypothetical protein